MKQTILLSLLSLNVMAQCPVVPTCTNTTVMCAALSNTNYSGNQCFTGYSSITNSVNWNNWDWLQFNSTTASLNIQQNINFGGGAKKVFNSGYAVNYWGNVSFNGSDTMVVGPNCTVQITNPISNNSNSGNYNTIVLGPGATLYIGANMVQYYAGDIIHTNPSNNSNNIYVVGCTGVPLGNKIVEFGVTGTKLSWFVEDSDDIQVQYTDDPKKPFKSIYFTSQNKGSLQLEEAGFYRLKADDVYSKIERFNMTVLKPNKPYFFMGTFYSEKPQTPYYGTK